jgi:hypothetical protein
VRLRAFRALKEMSYRAGADDHAQHRADGEIKPAGIKHKLKGVVHRWNFLFR